MDSPSIHDVPAARRNKHINLIQLVYNRVAKIRTLKNSFRLVYNLKSSSLRTQTIHKLSISSYTSITLKVK